MQMQQQMGTEKTDPDQAKQQIDEILQSLMQSK